MALECAGERVRAIQVGQAHMRLDPFHLPVALLWWGLLTTGSDGMERHFARPVNALRERQIFAAGTAFWRPLSRNWGL
jgi:hypothetical protein